MGKVIRAAVVANRKKPIAVQVKRQVEAFLLSRGIAISQSSPQLVITVGGDGTILFSKKYYGIPFFAIGSSTSFMCQSSFSDWKGRLKAALLHLRVEPRMLLEAKINGKLLPLSLNEIGIRNPEPRVMSLHLSCGHKQFAFRADGIMFCTPTGSPAYCYSCGGRQMKRTLRQYQAVAISPFRRTFKPHILPGSSDCALRLSGLEKSQLFIDGQVVGTFRAKDTLWIKGSSKKFLFAKA